MAMLRQTTKWGRFLRTSPVLRGKALAGPDRD